MGLEHIYHVDQTYSLDFVYFNSADNNHRRTRNLYCQPSNGISAILRFSEVLNLPMESRSCFFRFCNFVVDALQEGEKTKTKTSRFLIERGAFAPLFLNGIWLNTIVAKYSYLANDTKLAAENADDCGFSYRGSFTYRTDESSQPDRVFESTSFGGGRIVGTVNDETEVRYFLTDHLGSVRAVVNSGCEVLERNDYQPFGKRWVTPSMPVSDNRDRFNGKEDQSFAGLPFSDYGARMYDYERGRWLTQDRFAEKYYSIGQYNYCAGNPVNYIDIKGDSLMIIDMASIISIYNGLAQGQTVTFRMNNGVLDPTSFADVATNSDDFFLQDLFNIAQNSTMVELSTASHYTYLDQNGVTHTNTFEEAPYDSFTSDIPEYERYLLENGEPIGRSIVGNLGQTKFPGAASLSGRRSTNKNVQIVINAKGNINHQSVGLADEFGHVLLYMQGLPHGHGSPSANTFINKRTNAMKIRLGYDF